MEKEEKSGTQSDTIANTYQARADTPAALELAAF